MQRDHKQSLAEELPLTVDAGGLLRRENFHGLSSSELRDRVIDLIEQQTAISEVLRAGS